MTVADCLGGGVLQDRLCHIEIFPEEREVQWGKIRPERHVRTFPQTRWRLLAGGSEELLACWLLLSGRRDSLLLVPFIRR